MFVSFSFSSSCRNSLNIPSCAKKQNEQGETSDHLRFGPRHLQFVSCCRAASTSPSSLKHQETTSINQQNYVFKQITRLKNCCLGISESRLVVALPIYWGVSTVHLACVKLAQGKVSTRNNHPFYCQLPVLRFFLLFHQQLFGDLLFSVV